jgi:hypothetical protein
MEESEASPITGGVVGDDNENWSQRGEAHESTSVDVNDEDNPQPVLLLHAVGNSGDDDDWSRQVETDTEIDRMSSSVMMEGDVDDMETSAGNRSSMNLASTMDAVAAPESIPSMSPGSALLDRESTSTGLAPKREEKTLKEKLVERERQRRVETERARLKQQFALSGDGGVAADEDSTSGGAYDVLALRENGSVAGTVGEGSIVAQIDTFDNESQKLPYPMERFLQDQGNVIEEEPTRESQRDVQNQGIFVMERFLQEPVNVDSQVQGISEVERPTVDRSVSFDMEPHLTPSSTGGDLPAHRGSTREVTAPESIPSLLGSHDDFLNNSESEDVGASVAGNISIANASMTCITSEDPHIGDLGEGSDASEMDGDAVMVSRSLEIHPVHVPESPSVDRSPSSDQPRFFRLTEAEIEEMAAIDEASRSNAPPSDRDDFSDSSFVGELVSDFPGPMVDHVGTLSQGTPTTAMESASMASGNQSAQRMSENADDQHSIDAMGTTSISSHIAVSSEDGSVSVTVNPPSDTGGDDPLSPIPDEVRPVPNISGDLEQHGAQSLENSAANAPSASQMWGNENTLSELHASAVGNAGIVNRQIRPGMTNTKRRTRESKDNTVSEAPSTPIRRSLSVPNKMHFDVDGFDYDKNAAISPGSGISASIRDISANDMWSPGSKLSVSPVHQRGMPSPDDPDILRNYGTGNGLPDLKSGVGSGLNSHTPSARAVLGDEMEPLLPDIPHEIVARHGSRGSQIFSSRTFDPQSLRTLVDDVFSDIRSESTATINAGQNEAQDYLDSSFLKRGERRAG